MNSQNGAEEKKFSQNFSSASKNPPDKPEDNFFIKGPSISLPKGGGALKNIDEKFEVNAANGTATFSMSLPLSKGRNNLQPELSLTYNSGSGNSIFGLGWNVSYASIQRKTDKQLPRYFDNDESDVFMFTGVEDLVPALEQDDPDNWNAIDFTALTGERVKRYRPRIESGFHRIERITPKNSKIFYWKVTTSKNVVTIFGRSISARIVDPQNENKIFKWLPELSFDDQGNCMEYEYVQEDLINVPQQLHEQNRLNQNAKFANTYLKRIKYANNNPYKFDTTKPYAPNTPVNPDYLFETVFDFGDHDENVPTPAIQNDWFCRIEPFSDYHAGFEIRTYRLCRRVLFFHYFKELNDGETNAPTLVRSLDIGYRYFNNPSATVNEKRNAETDFIIQIKQTGYKKSGNAYTKKSLPPVEFGYQELKWDNTIKNISAENLVNAPVGLGQNYQWLDLWNEGISGIFTEQANGWFYKSNLGNGNFTEAQPVIPKPSFTGMSGGQLQLQDLEADGRKFVVSLQGNAKGYFELSDDYVWEPFQSFVQLPDVNFNDANTKLIDLDGDGKADLIISEENVFTWYANKGMIGYDEPELAPKPFDEEKGAALLFFDAEQKIFLADMSGDGMTDIVRIRNGEVCYWPNMGYGKFGARVSMSFAPYFDTADLFNPSYIHLADISGTGASDIIYLGKNQFKAWLNLSGNAWSETTVIDPFTNTELPNQITVVDLLGNGTSSIVWSSSLPGYTNAPMRYIDLMGGNKPYIMNFYKNNFGKEVSCEYKSSTFFYLEDKKAGKPWITKLPFPVQCVSKVNTNDKVAGTYFTNQYTYHHGYYDHTEREFRGFGRVDQIDTEDFENFKLSNANNVVEEDLHQPPVKRVTWFHTGAFDRNENILKQFATEYNKGPFEFDLIDPLLEGDIYPTEYREAFRACKSKILREEVYAMDGSLSEDKPFTVSMHNCFIRLLQPKQENKFTAFLVAESEAANYYYERNENDPRIAHTFNIAIDKFGNVTESASVVYGRKITDAQLPLQIQQEQNKIHITYTQTDFTNDFDLPEVYRLSLIAETKTFELTGATPASIAFKINELKNNFSTAAVIKYEDTANNLSLQKRLIEDVRTTYLNNDLVTEMPLHQMDLQGLQYQQYKMAFTPSMITHLFGSKVANQMLIDAKYEQPDGTNWWIASGRNIYLNNAETVANAVQRFFQPVAIRDAFDFESKLFYDEYFLVLNKTEDAVQNIHEAEVIDYRIMQASKLKDANDNINETITDELGMVIATSTYGDEGDGLHGDASLSTYTIILPANIAEVINDPHKFLQQATTFFYYDLFEWMNNAKPVCFANVVRETHESDLPQNQLSRVFLSVGYSSGNGGLLQTKLQAEPGIALQWQNGAIVQIDTTPNLRWISNGRTVLNNKGNPVKQYEPFFSTTFEYESEDALVEIGFTPVLYYDTLGRNIRTEFADGTISRVEFDAWKQLSFDQNDMVLDSSWYVDRGSPNPISPEPANPETRAAWLAAKHANTPGESHFDSLGRTIYSIANNGALGKYASTTILDIENNKRAVIDARNNTVVQFEYDMISRVNHQTNMDSGERWMLADGLSKPSFKWDDLKHEFIFEYDALHRPTKNWIIEDVMQSTPKKLIGLTVYGENQNSDKTLNLREKVFQIFDQSGLVETTEYDFKGNAKSSFKQLAKDYKNIISLDVVNPVSLLEVEQFSASSKFNAVNKPVELDMPDGSQIFPSYNETNLLKQVNVFINSQNQNIPFVQNITYDAKSQREKILYGNNTLTRYTYDEKAYRLKRILTTRNNGADILQDLNYTYDPVANITQIQDAAQQTIFFNNAGVIPENKFEYDAIYRLIHATGREHAGQNAPMDQFDFDKTKSGGQRLTLKGDMNAMQNYEQIYDYDNAGNMMHIIHNAGNGIFQNKWTQTFNYNPNNNQLHSIQVGANTTTFNYDAHGNQQNLQDNTFPLTWNYADQLQQIDLGGGGIVYYVYDSTGQRVRKVIENGNLIKERIYLTNYEIYRETQNNNVQLERETLHIMDDKERIALVETRTKGEDAGLDFLIRYQYSNHLRTACLEITGDQNNPEIISYEEYYPFGNTSYQAMRNQTETSKRYRYTGKERDEESGLYYHGARYYAPWLARWTASDPKGIDDGLNVYSYVNNNPIKLHDPTGGEGESNDKEKKPATPATTVTTPPQYSLLFPYTYQSWGDQVGKDSGATASFYFDIFKDSKQFDELKKLALDPQLNILKSGFEKEWDKNKPSLILGAAPFVLSTAGILTYLSVINPKLDIPIVGKTPARTIGFGALSLGFKGLSKLADDKFKLEVGYKEDDKTSKGTYSGELELQGDKGTSVKFGIGLGYEQSFKYGFTAPLTSDLKLSSEFEFKQKDTSRSFTATVAVPIKVGGTTLYFENKAFIQSGPTSTESPFSPKFNTDDLSKPAVSIFNQPFQGSGVFFSLTIPTSVPKKEEKK